MITRSQRAHIASMENNRLSTRRSDQHERTIADVSAKSTTSGGGAHCMESPLNSMMAIKQRPAAGQPRKSNDFKSPVVTDKVKRKRPVDHIERSGSGGAEVIDLFTPRRVRSRSAVHSQSFTSDAIKTDEEEYTQLGRCVLTEFAEQGLSVIARVVLDSVDYLPAGSPLYKLLCGYARAESHLLEGDKHANRNFSLAVGRKRLIAFRTDDLSTIDAPDYGDIQSTMMTIRVLDALTEPLKELVTSWGDYNIQLEKQISDLASKMAVHVELVSDPRQSKCANTLLRLFQSFNASSPSSVPFMDRAAILLSSLIRFYSKSIFNFEDFASSTTFQPCETASHLFSTAGILPENSDVGAAICQNLRLWTVEASPFEQPSSNEGSNSLSFFASVHNVLKDRPCMLGVCGLESECETSWLHDRWHQLRRFAALAQDIRCESLMWSRPFIDLVSFLERIDSLFSKTKLNQLLLFNWIK